jgi:hypothetical protein
MLSSSRSSRLRDLAQHAEVPVVHAGDERAEQDRFVDVGLGQAVRREQRQPAREEPPIGRDEPGALVAGEARQHVRHGQRIVEQAVGGAVVTALERDHPRRARRVPRNRQECRLPLRLARPRRHRVGR